MPFPDSFVDEVRRTADIVRFVSEHVQLKKMGTSYKGLCPFHQEKTPSFNVNNDRGAFHCFGCGVGGDVFKFAMLHDKVSFPEAIEIVARRFGIPVPENRYEQGPDRKERDEMLVAARRRHRALHAQPLVGAGHARRASTCSAAGSRKRRWSASRPARPRIPGATCSRCLKRRFPVGALMTAGLVREGQKSNKPYDWFRNRAVFPILSDTGRIVGFGARSLDGSEPKYLNSPESPVYQKSTTLYGLSWAKEAIRRVGRVVLMEGYLDVARALENGVDEVVATCGTALTPAHARLIRRFTEKVIVNFDQDEAGQNAARKSLDLLLEEGLKVHVVELPAGDDPDTFLKAHGGDAYRARLDEAPAGHGVADPPRRAGERHQEPGGQGRLSERAAARAGQDRQRGRAHGLAARDRRARRPGRRGRARRAAAGPGRAGHGGAAEGRSGGRPRRRPRHRSGRLVPAEKLLLTLHRRRIRERSPPPSWICRRPTWSRCGPRTSCAPPGPWPPKARRSPAPASRTCSATRTAGCSTRCRSGRCPSDGVAPEDCVRELRCGPLKARMAEIQKDLARATGADQEALLSEKLMLKRRMTSFHEPVTQRTSGASK